MGRTRAAVPGWVGQAPAPAHVYLAHFRVRHHELDPLGYVNNAADLNYLEQAAIDHAEAPGDGAARLRELGGVFLAPRHEVDYLSPAMAGDWLRVATWALALAGARAVRAYEVSRLTPEDLAPGPPPDRLLPPAAVPAARGEVVIRARTEWAYVDVATGRPRRLPPEVRAEFLRSE